MGMDPQAMAGMQGQGAAPAAAPGAALQFNLIALFVMYLANNWKIVIAIQDLVLKLVQPMLSAADARKESQAKAASAVAAAAQRKARLARLKASKAKVSASASADDESDD